MLPPTYQASAQILLERDRVELGKIADVLTAPVISELGDGLERDRHPALDPGARRRRPPARADRRSRRAGRRRPARPAEPWRRRPRPCGGASAGSPASVRAPPPRRNRADGPRGRPGRRRAAGRPRRHPQPQRLRHRRRRHRAARQRGGGASPTPSSRSIWSTQQRTKREAADRALAWMRGEIERPARADRRAEPRHPGRSGARCWRPRSAIRPPPRTSCARSATRWRSPAPSRPTPIRGSSQLRAALAASRRHRRRRGDRHARARRRPPPARRPPAAARRRARLARRDPAGRGRAAGADRLADRGRPRPRRPGPRAARPRPPHPRPSGIQALQRESTSLQQVALALEPAQVAIIDLEREAAASQELYVVLLTRLNEITAQKESIAPDARVLNAAVPPEEPTGPAPRPLCRARRCSPASSASPARCSPPTRSAAGSRASGALEAATGLTVLAAVRRRPRPARLVDRDLGTLPAEDGVELALALHEPSGACPLVALAPAGVGRRPPRCSRRGWPRRPRGAGGGSRSSKSAPIRIRPAPAPSACRSTASSSGGRRRRRGDRRCGRRRRRCAAAAATAVGLGARPSPGPGSPTAASSWSPGCARRPIRCCVSSPACARPAPRSAGWWPSSPEAALTFTKIR